MAASREHSPNILENFLSHESQTNRTHLPYPIITKIEQELAAINRLPQERLHRSSLHDLRMVNVCRNKMKKYTFILCIQTHTKKRKKNPS